MAAQPHLHHMRCMQNGMLFRHAVTAVQIKKEEDELNVAFGTSSIQAKVKALQEHKNPQGKTTAIMLFGNAKECETAQVMPCAFSILST